VVSPCVCPCHQARQLHQHVRHVPCRYLRCFRTYRGPKCKLKSVRHAAVLLATCAFHWCVHAIAQCNPAYLCHRNGAAVGRLQGAGLPFTSSKRRSRQLGFNTKCECNSFNNGPGAQWASFVSRQLGWLTRRPHAPRFSVKGLQCTKAHQPAGCQPHVPLEMYQCTPMLPSVTVHWPYVPACCKPSTVPLLDGGATQTPQSQRTPTSPAVDVSAVLILIGGACWRQILQAEGIFSQQQTH
jgi:hypothetical protein